MAPCSYSAPSCGRLHPRWWWAVGELPANDGHCGPVVLSKDLRRWCHIHKVVDQWPPPGVLPALPNYECHPKNAFYATYASPHGSVSWTSTLLVPACCVKLFLFPRFGPLVRHWTMRFEAKHSYFKQLAQAMGNFINLPYSLAMRHQHLRCYQANNVTGIPGDGLIVGPGII